MAKVKEKDSERVYFSLLTRFGKGIKKLTDDEAGRLLKAIYDFELEEQEPDFDEEEETLLSYLWSDIHEWLENNKRYYRKKCEMASLAGKLSAKKRKLSKTSDSAGSATVVNGRQRSSTIENTNTNKNINKNKNINTNPNEKEREKEKDDYVASQKAVRLIKSCNMDITFPLMRLAKEVVLQNPDLDDEQLKEVFTDFSSDEDFMVRYEQENRT